MEAVAIKPSRQYGRSHLRAHDRTVTIVVAGLGSCNSVRRQNAHLG